VNDRSTDATGHILDTIAEDDPRLRVVHVRELPPGWLGKNHALERGAERSSAEWLLFTDADVVFAPGTLRRAVAWAVAQRADHVTAAPEVPLDTLGERLFLTMFGTLFLLYSPPWRVENPRSPAHLGIGAFNLLRAEVFRSIGGLRGLALSIDDDMRLGQRVKAGNYSTRVLLGYGALRVRWHESMWGMIRGVEKNFFAGLDFSLVKVVFGIMFILWLGAAPHVGVFFGPWWARGICALGVASVCLLLGQTAWQSRIGWYYGLLMPASAVLSAFALARSTFLTLLQNGVRWRDHFYPLAELRRHARLRNAWTKEAWKSTR
jgi:glycosyltransferase involved in cell wall biosynthesis